MLEYIMQNYKKNKTFQNILITGGAENVGGHIGRQIIFNFKKIFIIDNYSKGYRKNFPKILI